MDDSDYIDLDQPISKKKGKKAPERAQEHNRGATGDSQPQANPAFAQPLWPGQQQIQDKDQVQDPKIDINQDTADEFIPETPPVRPNEHANSPWYKPQPPRYDLFADPQKISQNFPQTPQAPKEPKIFSYRDPSEEDYDDHVQEQELEQEQDLHPEDQATEAQLRRQARFDRLSGKDRSNSAKARPFVEKERINRQPAEPMGLRLNKQDVLGIFSYVLLIAKQALFSPQRFFSNIDPKLEFGEPFLFLLFVFAFSSIANAMARFNIIVLFHDFFFSFVSALLGAWLTNQIMAKMGGKDDFNKTFAIVAFSKATALFSWIALGPVPLGMASAVIYTGYMNYIGFKRLNPKMSEQKLVTILVILIALGVLFRQGAA